MEGYLKKIFVAQNDSSFVQFLRYALVGGAAAFVDISVYTMLSSPFHINPILSNTVSFTFGLFVNYFMSRNWVFQKQSHNLAKDFLLFAVIGIMGLFLSNFILYILINRNILSLILRAIFMSGSDDFIRFTAKLIAVFIVLFWNFIARKKIVFS
jgi:putative flippase GtrA